MTSKTFGLSRKARIGYGTAEMGISGAEILIRVSLLIFYTDVIGLRPELAGYAIAVGVFWDAITDPLMGRISDQARIGNQRRRPFFMPGAVGLAISLVMLFSCPLFETQTSKFLYLLFTYLLTNTCMTVLAVPHTALAGDLSQDERVRTELFGWRLFFGNLGLILGTALPAMAAVYFVELFYPDVFSSICIGVVIILCSLITILATRGQDKAPKSQVKESFRISLYIIETVRILRQKNFRYLLLSYMVATIGLTLNSSLALYYYKYRLHLEEGLVRGVIVFFLFIFCLSIPLWVYAARFFSKKNLVMFNVLGLGVMTSVAYPLFPSGSYIGPLCASVVGGIFVGAIVLLDVWVADLADEAKSKPNARDANYGIYFGIWKMGSKASRAIALALAGQSLAWIGLNSPNVSDVDLGERVAFLFGPGVGFFLLFSIVVLFWINGESRSRLKLK